MFWILNSKPNFVVTTEAATEVDKLDSARSARKESKTNAQRGDPSSLYQVRVPDFDALSG